MMDEREDYSGLSLKARIDLFKEAVLRDGAGTINNNQPREAGAVKPKANLRNKIVLHCAEEKQIVAKSQQSENAFSYQKKTLLIKHEKESVETGAESVVHNFKELKNTFQQSNSVLHGKSQQTLEREASRAKLKLQEKRAQENTVTPSSVQQMVYSQVLNNNNTQKQLIPDFSMFKEIDRHAKNVPSQASSSIVNLVQYLISGAKNELEKARAIFVWIADNIKYDYAYSKSHMTPEQIMKAKGAVCEGYSVIFGEMCRLAGFQCIKLQGFAKGAGYKIGQEFSESDAKCHAWNAVHISGQWRLVDSTWGSGSLGDSGTFNRKIDNHYFMADPEALSWSHFPVDDSCADGRWQLISKPLTLNEFNSLPRVYSYFFKYGLELSTGKRNPVIFQESIELRVFSAQPTEYIFKVQREQETKNGSMNRFVMHHVTNDVAYFKFNSPAKGRYSFDLYAKPESEMSQGSTLDQTLTMLWQCERPNPNHFQRPFPKANGDRFGPDRHFRDFNLKLVNYRGPILKANQELIVDSPCKLTTLVKVQNTEEVSVNGFFKIGETGQRIVITATPSTAGYFILSLFGRPEVKGQEGRTLPHLGAFLIDNY